MARSEPKAAVSKVTSSARICAYFVRGGDAKAALYVNHSARSEHALHIGILPNHGRWLMEASL